MGVEYEPLAYHPGSTGTGPQSGFSINHQNSADRVPTAESLFSDLFGSDEAMATSFPFSDVTKNTAENPVSEDKRPSLVRFSTDFSINDDEDLSMLGRLLDEKAREESSSSSNQQQQDSSSDPPIRAKLRKRPSFERLADPQTGIIGASALALAEMEFDDGVFDDEDDVAPAPAPPPPQPQMPLKSSLRTPSFTIRSADLPQQPPVQKKQTKWQNEVNDLTNRQEIIRNVASLLLARKANPDQEWLKTLPHKARAMEEQLYRSAKSLEEYMDIRTLKNRLKKVAVSIATKFQDAKRMKPSSRRSSASSDNDSSKMRSGKKHTSNMQHRGSSTSTISSLSMGSSLAGQRDSINSLGFFEQLAGVESSSRRSSVVSNNANEASRRASASLPTILSALNNTTSASRESVSAASNAETIRRKSSGSVASLYSALMGGSMNTFEPVQGFNSGQMPPPSVIFENMPEIDTTEPIGGHRRNSTSNIHKVKGLTRNESTSSETVLASNTTTSRLKSFDVPNVNIPRSQSAGARVNSTSVQHQQQQNAFSQLLQQQQQGGPSQGITGLQNATFGVKEQMGVGAMQQQQQVQQQAQQQQLMMQLMYGNLMAQQQQQQQQQQPQMALQAGMNSQFAPNGLTPAQIELLKQQAEQTKQMQQQPQSITSSQGSTGAATVASNGSTTEKSDNILEDTPFPFQW